MIRIVPDTNVLVSATFWTGDSFRILEIVDRGDAECVLSREILQEYEQVINREEITVKAEKNKLDLSRIIERISEKSTMVRPERKINAVTADPSDNKFLECAIEGKAEFIVSKDKHLLRLGEYEGVRIVSPEEFLNMRHEA